MALFPAPIKAAMYFKEKLNAVWIEWFRAIDRALPSGDIVDTSSVQTLTNKTLTSPVINTQATGTAILDEDDMASDSALKVSTQQAIRAYITSGTVAMSNKTLTSPVINTGVSGTALATTVGTPGSDTIVVSEQGIREAITAAGSAKLATGVYTGNGAATQVKTGLGFRPKSAMVYRQVSGYYAVYKTDQDTTKAYTFTGPTYLDDQIISLDADGFTVGDGTGAGGRENCNQNAVVYTYTAWG